MISHNHWDHKNGLGLILEKTLNKPDVYIVENDFKEYSKIIYDGLKVSLLPGGELYEQSVVLTQKKSMVLLTGCSHSGIVDMVKTVKKTFPDKELKLVAGGFHLMSKPDSEIMKISTELKDLNVVKIAPSHCTGDNAINYFRKDWGDKFIDFNISDELTI